MELVAAAMRSLGFPSDRLHARGAPAYAAVLGGDGTSVAGRPNTHARALARTRARTRARAAHHVPFGAPAWGRNNTLRNAIRDLAYPATAPAGAYK